MQLLTDEFIAQYPDAPEHMNELGSFVYYRTYSRWLEDKKRRETWKEAVRRAVEYNMQIGLKEFNKNLIPLQTDKLKLEAETLFDNIFNLHQFLSGRTHWVGGADTGVDTKFPLANFNCSFLNIERLDEEQNDLADLMYLLLVGTGVGFRCSKEMAENLPPVRTGFKLIHSEYEPVPKAQRLEETQIKVLENGYAKIYVGDSKEGWVQSLKEFFNFIVSEKHENIHTIKISYNSIRPKGERLRTFGGRASGYEPLKEMFEGFEKVLRNEIDPNLDPLEDADKPGYKKLRPIHILDMGNLCGANVVVGGVRRTAEIFLCDADDWECIFAKYGINGIWDEEKHKKVMLSMREVLGSVPVWIQNLETFNPNARPLHHRRMSNNSIAFETRPSDEMLDLVFEMMQSEGEPGFVNLEEANRRRPNAQGMNPCAEILLASYGVCNLTTVNVASFVRDEDGVKVLDYSGLAQAQALSARAGMRMTCLDLELPHWDEVQKRDRLIGTSLTGWKDAMETLEYDEEQEANLLHVLSNIVADEVARYSHILRIPTPLVDTTIKPEGTLSQVAGGVSSGLHVSHSPYYIRRIRINSEDPLAKVAQDLGWRVNPEIGTPGETREEKFTNARTLVIDFPVKSGAKKTKNDVYVEEQFDTYFRFQKEYTRHNSSNTIHVRPDEWSTAKDIVKDKWDEFMAVSFLAHDGGTYELAPYEECTEEEYESLKSSMKPFDAKVLEQYEASKEAFEDTQDEVDAMNCEGGACTVR